MNIFTFILFRPYIKEDMPVVGCKNATLDVDETLQNVTLVTHIISITCSSLLLVIFILNLKRISTLKSRMKNPLKRPRVMVVMQCTTHLIITQILQILLHRYGDNMNHSCATFWMQNVQVLTSLLFYTSSLNLFVIMFLLAKYLTNACGKRTFVCMHVIAYSVPLVVSGAVIAVRHVTDCCCWEWILLGSHALMIILMIGFLVYAIKITLTTASALNFTSSQKILRIWRAKKIRNGMIVMNILLVIWLCDVVRLADKAYYYSIRIAKEVIASSLGPCLLVFEGWYCTTQVSEGPSGGSDREGNGRKHRDIISDFKPNLCHSPK